MSRHTLFAIIPGLLLFLAAGHVPAQMYKYQDENGVWHFSDSPPPSDQRRRHPSQEGPSSSNKKQVIIHQQGKDDAPIFEASNTLPMPIQLEFSATQMKNMRAVPPLPLRKVIPAGSREPLTRFEKIDPDAPWGYTYRTRFIPGDPAAEHLTGKPYLPPFSSHKEFSIAQAFNGETSHNAHALTRYAIDIPMPADSTVHAARSGTVVEMQTGKLSPKRRRKTFYVRILHRDGTFGLYAHLLPDSVKLFTGMTINRGQVIGRLGSGAEESSPHLHFAVQKNVGMQLESIPFEFTSLEGIPQTPKTGLLLRHPL
ncbi:MAG: M23 family metallopeptidase [Thiohalophilus sp.]|uniref:M23 family metallopeptidase n=1 Tax=Thiohalophilus sp. TaxID=3028392 RepID=UPI0028700BE5|nr:M23 family metallopeptidase [Thiohalophilus sp.]MDR9435842.1 M23 family metallopeptidase [Thiohalophilus sp.]